MHIDVCGTTDGFVPQGVPRYFTSLLRKLGYQVKLHLEPSSNITAEMRRYFQISVDEQQQFPANGWSIYEAQRAQPVATGGKRDAPPRSAW
jgi:hypothetical protein